MYMVAARDVAIVLRPYRKEALILAATRVIGTMSLTVELVEEAKEWLADHSPGHLSQFQQFVKHLLDCYRDVALDVFYIIPEGWPALYVLTDIPGNSHLFMVWPAAVKSPA